MRDETTIFALSSGSGRAGIAVIRISGPSAGDALRKMLQGPLPAPRLATLARLQDPESGQSIDRGLALWFPGPQSFTGEDMAELHLHGGRAVVAAAVDALSALPGLRPADPGDFTRRAFEAGKLDLSAVEGLADLIDAETEAQRRQALRQMEGALARDVAAWRQELLEVLAHWEAAIDFPDEDLPPDLLDRLARRLSELQLSIDSRLADGGRGERLRQGFQVAIVGAPNVGKSSLLNALAQREAAIVSETAGTTRDVVEVHLDLSGYPVTLADTAGLRGEEINQSSDAQHDIEREGMRRAKARAAAADLILAVFDLSATPVLDEETAALLHSDSIAVFNKSDLRDDSSTPKGGELPCQEALPISVRSGAGLETLLRALEKRVVKDLAGAAPAITRARHRHVLEDCRTALSRAAQADLPELVAEDLRLALRALGRITGQVDVEDLLDVIFRDFCIGK